MVFFLLFFIIRLSQCSITTGTWLYIKKYDSYRRIFSMDKHVLSLNENWKFHHGELPDAWKKDFDDSSWEEVTLPHDWSVHMPFSRSYSSGTGYAAGGIGWYRGTFFLPEDYRHKRIFLLFDGIYKESQIWVNSYYHGFHPNGYTQILCDITSQVLFGADGVNEISVRVDRTELADSRWFTGSGITRKVSLLILEPICVEPFGTCFTTTESSDSAASFSITTRLSETAEDRAVSVIWNLKDANGNCVFSEKVSQVLSAGASTELSVHGTISSPELWSPEHPALYTLETWLCPSFTAIPYLADTVLVGLRSFSFDPDHGFFLNGVSTKIKGVCVHHDAGALGAAVTKEIWERRLYKLKKMGCNAIRMSHNPHMPELYDLCDEMGFLVMDEAFDEWEGPKNKWSTGHNVYPPNHQGYYKHFPQYHKSDLTSMILRDRNHPSVIMWSIGNEIDYPNDPYCHPLFQTMTGNNDANKPAAERMYNPSRPNAERLSKLAAMLAKEVRETDTTRPVTLAAAFPELSSQLGFLDALDVAGYNYKEHLYEDDHKRFPSLPFIGSENGHSLEAWRVVTDHDYISGQFLWTGIDYMGEAHGWPIRGSQAGIMTMAGFEKSGYYRRMSFWSETPMCHLVTFRADSGREEWKPLFESWNYCDRELVEVRCYTNLSQAELFLNGESLGVQNADPSSDCLIWKVPFVPGILTVKASGHLTTFTTCKSDSNAVYTASDSLETVSAPCALTLHSWQQAADSTALLGKNPIIQCEVTVTDPDGRYCSMDASMIDASVQGGQLLGMENGDVSDCTSYTETSRRAFHGRLIIYVKRDALEKPVTITVSSEMLRSASLTL